MWCPTLLITFFVPFRTIRDCLKAKPNMSASYAKKLFRDERHPYARNMLYENPYIHRFIDVMDSAVYFV